jgi:hypothetical protein
MNVPQFYVILTLPVLFSFVSSRASIFLSVSVNSFSCRLVYLDFLDRHVV